MAVATGWTLQEVLAHTPRQLQAITAVLEQQATDARMAAAHRQARGR
jgi:hypothetical protein